MELTSVIFFFVITQVSAENLPHQSDCPLNSNSLQAYIVRIMMLVERDKMTGVGTGVILTYGAVLSSCSNYDTTVPQAYTVEGQNSTIPPSEENVCKQFVFVDEIKCHPKYHAGNEEFFNTAIFVLHSPFNVLGSLTYPTVFYHPVLGVIFSKISYINKVTNNGCEIILWRPDVIEKPIFKEDSEIRTINYQETCVKYICAEKVLKNQMVRNPDPSSQEFVKLNQSLCEMSLLRRANGTLLCAERVIDDIYTAGPLGPRRGKGKITGSVKPEPVWMGAPLLCNGSMYGLVTGMHTRIVRRDRSSITTEYAYYVVTTVLRIWSWLAETTSTYRESWFHDVFVNGGDLSTDHFTPPPTKESVLDRFRWELFIRRLKPLRIPWGLRQTSFAWSSKPCSFFIHFCIALLNFLFFV